MANSYAQFMYAPVSSANMIVQKLYCAAVPMVELVRGDGLPLVQQVTQDLHRELGSRTHVYCGAGAAT